MHEVLAFMRAFPQTRETLCSEPVLAWLARQGIDAAAGVSSAEQHELNGRLGFWRATRLILERIGLLLVKPVHVLPGEAVIVRSQPDALVLFALAMPDGYAAIASSGCIRVERAPVLRVLRPG